MSMHSLCPKDAKSIIMSQSGNTLSGEHGGCSDDPLEKWCMLQRDVFRAQLGRLEGHLTNPFNDFHEPLLFADTPDAKEKLREWIAALDQLLGTK
jgi:hypothetical protein